MFKPLFNVFFAPEDSGSGGGNVDTYDLLKDDVPADDKPFDLNEDTEQESEQPVEKTADKEEDSDKTDSDETSEDDPEAELKELEEEVEEEKVDDKEDDLEELAVPVSRKEILKKFPTLFKEFPYLEKSYFREREFSKVFPTLDDARSAAKDSEILRNFDADLTNGDTSKILQAVKAGNPEAFTQIADNYLDVLNKVDRDAYLNVIGNVVKSAVISMTREARQSNNAALAAAASALNQHIFGTEEIQPPTKLSPEKKNDPEKERLQKEKEEFARQKFESARKNVNARINNTLRATIDANIDLNSSMTDYLRSKASGDAMDKVITLIEKDQAFNTLVGKLWANAEKNSYDDESMGKISRAYRNKAKVLLPAVLKSVRSEALRGMGRRSKSEQDSAPRNTEENPPRRRESTSPRNSGNVNYRGRPEDEAKKIPQSMSTRDFLMSD